MKHQEIRNLYLDFFKQKGYRSVSSAPIFLIQDPSLLFVNAGMNVFRSVFLGQEQPPFDKVVNIQKCIRMSGKHNDLEMVGKDHIHHTFFEMLGLWGFQGDLKEEALHLAFEFLVQVCCISRDHLWITVHEEDQKSYELISRLDIDQEHILFCKEDNFWDMGEVGPCGYCVEFHIDLGADHCTCQKNDLHQQIHLAHSCGRFLEIWNIVFIEYNRKQSGDLEKLNQCYIDGGMGLERLVRVLNHLESNYQSDLFIPIHEHLQLISGCESSSKEETIAYRVILDHIRSIVFSISDGIVPSNEGRGYVIRRLIRRALRFGNTLGLKNQPFLHQLVVSVVDVMGDVYPDLLSNRNFIEEIILREEKSFLQTLDRGLKLFEQKSQAMQNVSQFPSELVFKLYDTYGFPVDLTCLLCEEKGWKIDLEEVDRLILEQRQRSKKDALLKQQGHYMEFKQVREGQGNFEGYDHLVLDSLQVLKYAWNKEKLVIVFDRTPFYPEGGGQIYDLGQFKGTKSILQVKEVQKQGDEILHFTEVVEGVFDDQDIFEGVIEFSRREAITKNHTAAHILDKILCEVLGDQVVQKGQFVGEKYLRYDFSHHQRLTNEELNRIEYRVNQIIAQNYEVKISYLPLNEAINQGANAFFTDKYGEVVRMVDIVGVTKDLCGGTHVSHTSEIGMFKIVSENSGAAGIRRVEVLTGFEALKYFQMMHLSLQSISSKLGIKREEIEQKVDQLLQEIKKFKKEARQKVDSVVIPEERINLDTIKEIEGISFQIYRTQNKDINVLKSVYTQQFSQGIFLGLSILSEDKGVYCLGFKTSKVNESRFKEWIQILNQHLNGRGGGRYPIALGSFTKVDAIENNDLFALLN